MIISDLNYCEAVEFANKIIGGATADVVGDAYAGPGVATAYAVALAQGNITYTSATANTIVRQQPNVTISKAQVKADAFAIDETGRDKDKIRDTDVFVLHT
ncbi:MAG: hypothetical protein KME49_16040 [Brasilonema octagenarum HA4186-MV1]|jgi:hypothetical protein|uniref:Uncharacterized protein n=2 Tax=Brasilonema TaxID=383614 RepID=A0A856MQE5_9CYAN|nr:MULTISPECIES: hypothetical protein [Brasilonema]MBW4626965.1 hypothetical protein [Brasilonema octagenarum HA4186-MV1]NMF65070.1 hypothetical protein [Brasilonema octagenarum UFV-OR1]QDL11821.1 hypothetical protein DP114_31500 [Brasilonema sennae CENA114]QDL18201.1 hypothetical protein DP113_31635 [Brasilonema octagenarum UFV-E1]